MTSSDIIRLAQLADYPLLEFDGKKHVHAALLRMFRMAVAEEREACAQMVMPLDESLADAIRARGQS